MPYHVFFIPFSIWYRETCHGKEAECVCETFSAWLVLFWSVVHSGWYGHQICCDPVYEQLRGMLKFWSSMHCSVGLLYWDITTDLDISGCSRRCTKFVCVLSWSVSPSWRHGQASCTTLPSSKFSCLCSKISEWLCCCGFHLVEKTLASIWGAGAGWRGNSFTTFCLPGTAALFNPDAKDVGVATQLIDWSAVCEVRPCYSTLITILFSHTSLFTLFVMCWDQTLLVSLFLGVNVSLPACSDQISKNQQLIKWSAGADDVQEASFNPVCLLHVVITHL